MRRTLLVVVALGLGACTPRTQAGLPTAGTVVVKRDANAERYQVTWSGESTYNEGACEVDKLCVHLVRMVDAVKRTEVAITIFSPFEESNRDGSAGQVVDEWFEAKIFDPETDFELPAGAWEKKQ